MSHCDTSLSIVIHSNATSNGSVFKQISMEKNHISDKLKIYPLCPIISETMINIAMSQSLD